MMCKKRVWLLAAWSVAVWLSAVAAAEDVLEVIPKNAWGAVVLTGPAQLQQKLTGLSGTLKLPIPNVLAMAKQRLGMPADGHDRGNVAVAMIPAGAEGQPPTAVWFVATDDYAGLVKQLQADDPQAAIAKVTVGGQPALVTQRGGFAVITEASGQAALEMIRQATGTLAEDVKSIVARTAGSDLYLVATPVGIRMAQQQLLAGLAMLKAQIGQMPDEMAKNAEVGFAMYEALFQAMDKELSHVIVTVRLEQDATLRIGDTVALVEGSTLDQLSRTAGPAPENLLADLPGGSFVFAGGGILPAQWAEQLMSLSADILKLYFGRGVMTEEQARQMAEASRASVVGLRSMSMVMGLPDADESLYGNTTLVMKADDAAAYLTSYEKSVVQMSGMIQRMEKPPFSYDVQHVQVAGHDALRLVMDISRMIGAQQIPQAEKMMEKMFGKDGKMAIYLAQRDARTVVGSYVSEQRLARLLQPGSSDTALSQEAGPAATLALLPQSAQWVGLWSPQGTLQFVRQAVSALQAAAAAPIPELPATPPVGVAVSCAPGRFDGELVVPGEILQAAAKLALRFMTPPPAPKTVP